MTVMPRPANPEVRSRLLSVGRTVVHERGFNSAGVQDITAAADVPKGSFYNYFDSKESFAAEILEEYWLSIEQRHGPILYDARLKPLVRIRRFFKGLSQDHSEYGFALGCLIGNLSLELSNGSEETRAKLADVLDRWEKALGACLREAQERNELDGHTDPEQLAAIMIEAYEGAVMRGKVEQNGNAIERFEKVVLPRLIG
jgi:TetR/AcrR family transcriptional regulator, transcriptional repressor for nem operon